MTSEYTIFRRDQCVYRYVGAMYVAEVFDGVSEGALTLFREPVIAGNELAAGTPPVKFGCHTNVGNSRAFVA